MVYVPHKYRVTPQAGHTLVELETFLKTVPKNDCTVVCGDFNYQLKRNVEGLMIKWVMTQKYEDVGHDKVLLDPMRAQELFAVDTKFKPRAKY